MNRDKEPRSVVLSSSVQGSHVGVPAGARSSPSNPKDQGIDFAAVNAAALAALPVLAARWAPNGRRSGSEWVALNPTRADNNPGSFKINLRTGRWADFATGDKGGDVISLAAYLAQLPQLQAARQLASMFGLSL